MPSPSPVQLNLSEVLNVTVEDNCLLIEVVRKYPKVLFSSKGNQIFVEFPETTFHMDFLYDEDLRGKTILGLSYINDFTVQKNDADQRVLISLELKPGIKVLPKVLSTKGNIVKISILKPEENPNVVNNEIQEKYNKAVEEHTKGNIDSAIDLYNEVILKNKNFYLARFNLAKAYADKSKYNESINLLVSLLSDLKKVPQESFDKKTILIVANTLASVYYQTGYYDDAKRQLVAIVRQDPAYHQAYYNMGLINEKQKDLKLAQESFLKVIELKPDMPEAYYHLGVLSQIFNTKEDKKRAVIYFEKVIQLAPGTKLAEISQAEILKLNKKSLFGKK